MAEDKRCWRYKAGEEPRLFNSPNEVPEGEGWVDSPAKVDADRKEATEETAKRRGRPPKAS